MSTIRNYLAQLSQKHKKQTRVLAVLGCLSLLTVVVVVWQLKMTGITMTQATFCGQEAHTHTEDCYEAPYRGQQPEPVAENVVVAQEESEDVIQEINQGLNLQAYPIGEGNRGQVITEDLSIGGHQFNDLFFYGNVAGDDRVPFSDAASYQDYLVQTYLDSGKDLEVVREIWERYLYDLYDPSYDMGDMGNTGKGDYAYPDSTYGDTKFAWPKDGGDGPFHADVEPVIDGLDYGYLENGVDYSNMIDGLGKTASAVAAGDENTERLYDIELTADVQAKVKPPVVMVLQIQTSWQMFDTAHANKLRDNSIKDGTNVGAAAENTSLANLYDIKQALLRFIDYMDTEYPGNNLALAITDVEHSGTFTMFSGTDSNNNGLYVTNNPDILRHGILGWDTFGNCEHVHYSSDALEDACKNLVSNLSGWKDVYGNVLEYENIRKVGVMIGGPTENSDGRDGYGVELPWRTFQQVKLNSVYGIRTNEGTPLNDDGVISWIDNSVNNGTPFLEGAGSGFTDKYVASDEDSFFKALVDIAEREMSEGGIEVDGEEICVDNVTLSDTVQKEFCLNKEQGVTVHILNKDGTVDLEKTISLEGASIEILPDNTIVTAADDGNLIIRENPDKTTFVQYNYGTVYNTHYISLQFQIQARDDFIGSNNVYSNEGVPSAEYEHTGLDDEGNPTGEVDSYQVAGNDTPKVNVPIRFTAEDGEQTTIFVDDQVNLRDLSEKISDNAEDLIDNYPQINGTLSYNWVLPDGTEVPAGIVTVQQGSVQTEFPDRSYVFRGEETGEYLFTLKVTFTPENVSSSDPDFSDSQTAVSVDSRTEDGDVFITVVDSSSTKDLIVRKEWRGEKEHDGSVTFRLLADGKPVQDENGTELYTLSEENGWEMRFTDLPAAREGSEGQAELITYTVAETPVPDGWSAVYDASTRIEPKYGTEVILSLTFDKDVNRDKIVEVLYSYGETEYTFILASDSHDKFVKNKEYNFRLDELPLGSDGEPMECTDISVTIKRKGGDVENNVNTTAEITVEKIETGTVSTEEIVIVNRPEVVLPETGGSGTTGLTIGGVVLMTGSLLYGCGRRHRRERRL